MPTQNGSILRFNTGLVSPLALARIDLDRMKFSAETMVNWIPRVLGSMMLRPGLQYIGDTASDAKAVFLPFVYAASDTALLEFTNNLFRVWVNDALITRVSVSTAVTSGDFSAATGWTDSDEAGGTSTISAGLLSLVGDGTDAAIRKQTVTVAGGDQNKEHALRIIVTRGNVTFRCGSTDGGDEYIAETSLGVGTHSLAFTPTGDFYIQFSNTKIPACLVDSCQIEAAGVMSLPTPYLTADLPLIEWDTSASVTYVACKGYQQRKVERRLNNGNSRSWSIVLYQPDDGPFKAINFTSTTITPSDLKGDITLTASRNLFHSTHVGALFRLTSTGQVVTATFSAENEFSDPIKVTGVGSSQRGFSIAISGTWVATVTLQRSVGEIGAWIDVSTYTTNTTTTFNDGLDNQIIYYRLGIKTGNYTSGSPSINLTYTKSGGITGIVRVTAYSSATSVSAQVLVDLGGTTAVTDWYEGEWSDYRGWPSAVTLFDGRLWWAGKSRIYGSVSDAYESFDDTVIGDAGPLDRSIGSGPVDSINWLLPLQHMFMGTDTREISVRSSSLDDPLTPTNFGLKVPSTQGSAPLHALKMDNTGFFVQRSGIKLYRLDYQGAYAAVDYVATDTTELVPEIGKPGIVKIAAQRQIDTRIHCIRSDGSAAILLSDEVEKVTCWFTVQTDGLIEDVVILPGTVEDQVYYVVNRTINGVTKRYLEKWALESECIGGTLNKQADSFQLYSGAPATVLTGLSHLEAKTVVVWGDGKDLGTYTVSSGQITVSTAVSNAAIGLAYTAQFKSAKLAFAAALGTPLTQKKKINSAGLILSNTHYQGLQLGPDFTILDDMPQTDTNEGVVAANTIYSQYDSDGVSFGGIWATDPRLCIQAAAPRPCTVLAAVPNVTTNG